MGKEQLHLYLPGDTDQNFVVPGQQHATKDIGLQALSVIEFHALKLSLISEFSGVSISVSG